MELNGVPSTGASPPHVTLTFDPKNKLASVYMPQVHK